MERALARSAKPKRAGRRVNLRALAILGGLVVVAGVAYFPAKILSDRAARSSALEQIKQAQAAGDVDLTLRRLDHYMSTWPDDAVTLDMQGRLLADSARTLDQLLRAAAVNDQLLRLDPKGVDRQETRRRLVRLYVRHGDAIRAIAQARGESEAEAYELRYRAAAAVARLLIADGARDAESHRLLAQSLDGLAIAGDAKAQAEAVAEYKEALRLDPGNVGAAVRLAEIDLEKRNDAKADATLDALLKAEPKSPAVRLARYGFYTKAKKPERALAEIEAAALLAPEDASVRQVAATDALQRRDTASARRHLAAISAKNQDDLRVRVLRGMIDFAEQHPDEAVEQWRQGLTMVGGSDQDLTWQLAFALIQLGRVSEARPLVARYQQFEGDDRRSMGRLLRALLEQKLGHPARAIDDLERARDRVPEAWQGELQLSLGQCYEQIGDEGRAMIAYRKAATAMPRAVAPHKSIARLLLARDPDGALAEMERALAQAPTEPQLLYEVGRLRLAKAANRPDGAKDWSGVEDILARVDRLGPSAATYSLLTLRADLLVATGRVDQAVDLLGRSARGPERKRPEAWLAYASALGRLGRRDEALRVLEEGSAPDAAGDRGSLRIARAEVAAKQGRGQAARDLLTKDRDRLPKNDRPDLAYALSNLLKALGDREGTRAALVDWAKLQPDSPMPGLALLDLAQANDDDEAARVGLAALRAMGSDNDPYGLAARALDLIRPRREPIKPEEVARNLDEADRLTAQLLADAPQLPIGQFLRGMIFQERDRLDDAAKAYNLVLKKDPMHRLALGRLIEVLTKLKRVDDLADLERRYGDKSPGAAAAFDQIAASVSLKLGDRAQAEQAVARIVAIQPDNLAARAEQARLLESLGKPREAEATLRDLVARRPEDPVAWESLVTFLLHRGNPGEAAKAVDQLVTGYRGPRPELLRARCRWIVGDIAGAAKLYDDAVAAHRDDINTLRAAVIFDEAKLRFAEAEAALVQALKLDPKATWAARTLAIRLSTRPDQRSWAEAWALVAPGAPGSGEAPEDRLIRATLLSRSPEAARRAEAGPALAALADDLPASNPVAIEARCFLTQAWLDANRPAEAVRTITPAVQVPATSNPAALALATEAQARAGLVAEAKRTLERLTSVEPKSNRAVAAKAWTLLASGRKAEAASAIEAAVADAEATPDGEVTTLNLHALLNRMGLADAAGRVARRAAGRWPRHAHLVAADQAIRGEYAEAMSSCRSAFDAGSPREALRVAASLAVVRRNDPAIVKEADALAAVALAGPHSATEILFHVATIRHAQGRYGEEVALYREILATKPTNILFLNNMAWTLCEGLHQGEEALAKIDEVIRREGRSPAFLDTRGVILSRLGRFKEAIADLEEACKGQPSPSNYFHLARAYQKEGKPDQHARCRDLARKNKLDPATLDPSDKADLPEVMAGP